MRRRAIWLLLLVAVVAVMTFNRRRPPSLPTSRSFVNFSLKGELYQAVVASTPVEITQGLSDRDTIGADAMLFFLPNRDQPTFWMHRMRFPLDFIWLADGQVVDFHANVPPPVSSPAAPVATVRPDVMVELVLEVPAGFIASHQISKGDAFALISSWHNQLW